MRDYFKNHNFRFFTNYKNLITLIKSFFLFQKVYNYLELIAALAFGIVGFLLDDRQHRNAFLETRQSLEVKLVIEEQSAEQVFENQTLLFFI